MNRQDRQSNEATWRLLATAVAGRTVEVGASDPAALVSTAGRHGVAQLLDRRRHEGTLTGLPPRLVADLRAFTQRQAALDLALNEATRRFVELLHRNGIPALLLKGAPIAHLHYDATFLRPRCDTDIYIRAEQLRAVANLLSREGYRLAGLDEQRRSSRQYQAARETFQGEDLWFDIHYRLSNRALFQQTLPFAECLEASRAVPALGEGARTLASVDLLLHACIHRIAHGRNAERNRLIWLYDIHLLFSHLQGNERDAFVRKALDRAVGAVCADALAVCAECFGTDAGADALEQLRSNAGNEPSARLVRAGKASWAWEDLKAERGLANRLRFARELLENRLKN